MATFNSQISLDYSQHSFRHLSCASHPHSLCCISRVSLVSAITLPCLSRLIINRHHRAKSLAFIIHNHPAISLAVDHYPQSRYHVSRVSLLSTITLPYVSRLITAHNGSPVPLWRLWSTVTLPCLCSLTQPHGLLCLICMPRRFVSLNPEACLVCSPVTQNMTFRLYWLKTPGTCWLVSKTVKNNAISQLIFRLLIG